MKQISSRVIRALILALGVSVTVVLHAADIEPPKAQLVDRNGINMANGQVTHSLNTVSIGGAMGLSHSVLVLANEFNYIGYKGFRDKFLGEARNMQFSTANDYSPRQILRVSDFLGSADFAYYMNGVIQQGGDMTSGYSYVSIGDERQILEYDNSYLYWTHPDGTVSRFSRGVCAAAQNSVPCANSYALLVDVTYPNGFVITVWSAGMGVTTNTGFELKALYPPDYRPMDKTDRRQCVGSSDTGCLRNAPPVYLGGSSANYWSISNPTYIVGINDAYEYCTPTATDCTLTRTWPKATFNWPAGMPRTMYLGSTSMNVVNAAGQQTTYTFQAYDMNIDPISGNVEPGYTQNTDFSPRLVSVAPYGTTPQFTYDYKNVWAYQPYNLDVRLQTAGVVKQATRWGLTTIYDMNSTYDQGNNLTLQVISGGGGINPVHLSAHVQGAPGALRDATTEKGVLKYEGTPRNFVTEFDSFDGPQANYTYTRSNLTTISYNNGDTTVTASYPADCVSTPRKVCNQATWIKDAKGNYTYYTYHAASGQVQTVTYPANKHGISPQVRYEYTQLSAHYYNGGSSKITGSPIWMKTAERTCINSNTVSGACQGGDEVVTRYEYNNDNLLMTGM
ncbi:MAG: hypothetical protein ABUL58_03175, partial [Steroidobacter sp.]